MSRHRQRRINLHSWYLWHRYIGLVIALFLLMMAISGWMLNHTHSLQLSQRTINLPGLLHWYGIKPPTLRSSFQTQGQWVSQWGNLLFWNSQLLEKEHSRLVGAIHHQDMLIIATEQNLWLLNREGELLDRLNGETSLPGVTNRLGTSTDGYPVLQSGKRLYRSDPLLLTWQDFPPGHVTWSEPSQLPPSLDKSIRPALPAMGPNLERLMLDLHSGRLFGRWGVLLYDTMALLTLFSALSGLVLWGKRHRSRSRR